MKNEGEDCRDEIDRQLASNITFNWPIVPTGRHKWGGAHQTFLNTQFTCPQKRY